MLTTLYAHQCRSLPTIAGIIAVAVIAVATVAVAVVTIVATTFGRSHTQPTQLIVAI